LSKKGLIVIITVLIALVAACFYLIAPKEGGLKEKGETEGQQTSMENLPVNSTRGFTLQIGNETVYFEFVNLEVLKDREDMLFMPNESTVIDDPFIACMKFSFRAKDSGFPERFPEIMIEMYDEKEREWTEVMTLLATPSLAATQGGILNSILVTRDGDRFDIYWGAYFPPVVTPIWFRGMDEDVRLHAFLRVPEVETYHTGDTLYQAGNLTVVYDTAALHVYMEPFELPYVKFKVEDAKFLSASEISSQLELTLRNVGSLPLIGTIHWGDEDSIDFHVFPTYNIPIIVVNGEEFDFSSLFSSVGSKCDIPRDPKHIINLPKPWEEEGWAAIIYPNETFKIIIPSLTVSENRVVIRGQEGEITLNAKPKIERITNVYAPSFPSFTLGELDLEVKNEGDSPFFAKNATIEVWANGREVLVGRKWGVVLPNGTGRVEIGLEGWVEPVDYEELIGGFDIRVKVESEEAVYNVPPLAPKIEVTDVKTHTLWEDICDGIDINITNNWIFPIEAKWAEVYVEGKPIEYYTEPEYCVIDPGETETFTVNFVDDVKIGSTVEVKLGFTSVKVKV